MPYDACGKVCRQLSAVAAVAAGAAVASAVTGAASVPPSVGFGVFSMLSSCDKRRVLPALSAPEHFCSGFRVLGSGFRVQGSELRLFKALGVRL